MAESVNRRESLAKAWAEYTSQDGDPMTDAIVPTVSHRAGFVAGYNAAWAALLSEIRPLVDSLSHVAVTPRIPLAAMREEAHNAAVKRLRELVRERVE